MRKPRTFTTDSTAEKPRISNHYAGILETEWESLDAPAEGEKDTQRRVTRRGEYLAESLQEIMAHCGALRGKMGEALSAPLFAVLQMFARKSNEDLSVLDQQSADTIHSVRVALVYLMEETRKAESASPRRRKI